MWLLLNDLLQIYSYLDQLQIIAHHLNYFTTAQLIGINAIGAEF